MVIVGHVLLLTPRTTAATLNGSTYDTGMDVGRLTVVQAVGSLGGVSPTLSGKIQESADGGVWTDVLGGQFPLVDASDIVNYLNIRHAMRYVRYRGVVTGAAPLVPLSVTAITPAVSLSTGAADIIAAHFISIGMGLDPFPIPVDGAWAITVGEMPPDKPDNVVCITDTGAALDGKAPDGTQPTHPFLSIMIRALSYGAGIQKGQEVEAELRRFGAYEGAGKYLPAVNAGGKDYLLIASRIRTSILKVGMEEQNRRQLFSLNVAVTLKV